MRIQGREGSHSKKVLGRLRRIDSLLPGSGAGVCVWNTLFAKEERNKVCTKETGRKILSEDCLSEVLDNVCGGNRKA